MKKFIMYYAGYCDLVNTYIVTGYIILFLLEMIFNEWRFMVNLLLIVYILVFLFLTKINFVVFSFQKAREINEKWKQVYDKFYKEEK